MRSLKISILCSSTEHPVNKMLYEWIEKNSGAHSITLCRSKSEVDVGDLLFLISCSEIVGGDIRGRFHKTLVLHASDLPKGRGWSPHVWEISQGAEFIVLTLLEAEDSVDSGAVWHKLHLPVSRSSLFNEINEILFSAERDMLDFAVANFDTIRPVPQSTDGESYYSRRTPEHSRLDPKKTIEEQFDLIRVCDPNRFPAFFDLHGSRYKIVLEKI